MPLLKITQFLTNFYDLAKLLEIQLNWIEIENFFTNDQILSQSLFALVSRKINTILTDNKLLIIQFVSCDQKWWV